MRRRRVLLLRLPARGRAVQVDPNKPKLKAPGYKRLKLKLDKLLSSFAFNFNLRRHSVAYVLADLRTTARVVAALEVIHASAGADSEVDVEVQRGRY